MASCDRSQSIKLTLSKQKLWMLCFVRGEGLGNPSMFLALAVRKVLRRRLFPPYPLYLELLFPSFAQGKLHSLGSYRNTSTCMRCMRPGLVCRSDFNRPNFRAFYTAKASASRLNAFRTPAMSSPPMSSALRFEINARCSVS